MEHTLKLVTDLNYRETVSKAAASLRRTADRIEREGLSVRTGKSVSGALPYAYAAHSAIHEAVWGIANANLDGIVTAAGEADAAHTDKEA